MVLCDRFSTFKISYQVFTNVTGLEAAEIEDKISLLYFGRGSSITYYKC